MTADCLDTFFAELARASSLDDVESVFRGHFDGYPDARDPMAWLPERRLFEALVAAGWHVNWAEGDHFLRARDAAGNVLVHSHHEWIPQRIGA
jgi:hypothetical protein